ncbi:MAG: hypothetical protein GY950_24425, partial [bacterium]|nr:hypothetical protein [bacterium]
WPLMKPGGGGFIHRYFEPGTYFYYSLPQPVESRRVTFLKRVLKEPGISGKGPHRLELNKSLKNLWLEDAQRSPDIYNIVIRAPIKASLTVSGEMAATIFTSGGEKTGTTGKGKWTGQLPAGSYNLEVKSIEENNKVPYTISLNTKYLIPGLVQQAGKFPAQLCVSLEQAALVDMTSFGDVDVKAALWDNKGKTRIVDNDDMPHDWNFRISRNFKPGHYHLRVDLADKRGGSVEIRMQTRKELLQEPQTIPFIIRKKITREVLKIPFNTGESETLLQVKSKSGGPLKLVLMRGDTRLAE